MRSILADEATGEWAERHNAAFVGANFGYNRGFSAHICNMLLGWARYAEAHKDRYESPIGEDYFIGKAWADQGRALRTLLNGETGRLDCGTLDAFILNTAADHGVNLED